MLRSRNFLRAEKINRDSRAFDEERWIRVSPTVNLNSMNVLTQLQERKDGFVKSVKQRIDEVIVRTVSNTRCQHCAGGQ